MQLQSSAGVAWVAGHGWRLCTVSRGKAKGAGHSTTAWSSAVERRGSRLARVGKGKAVTDVLWSSGGSAAACAHGGRPLRVLVLAGAAVKKKKEAWGQSEQRLYIG